MTVAAIAAVGTAALAVVFPMGFGLAIDAIVRGDRERLALVACLLLAVSLARLVLGFTAEVIIRTTGELIVKDVRQDLFAHLVRLDAEFFARRQLGELLAALTGDVVAVRTGSTDAAAGALVHGLKLLLAATVMLVIDWHLAAFVLATAPVVITLARRGGARIELMASSAQRLLANAAARAHETLAAIRCVTLFDRRDHQCAQYEEALTRAYEENRSGLIAGAALSAVVELLFATAAIALFWVGGRQVVEGRITAGLLVTFLMYSDTTSQSANGLITAYRMYREARGGAERLTAIFAERSRLRDPVRPRELPRTPLGIEFSRVSFSHGPTPILRDVSLRIEPGEVVALVGPSGAGKSTIASLMARLTDPTCGSVRLGGRDLRELSTHALRANVSLVLQDTRLLALSVRENIRFARLDASDEDVVTAARDAEADTFIRNLPQGYETQIGDNGTRLSGGQRQRLALAQAFLRQPKVLILDEATSAVDVRAERAILAALARRSQDCCTVIITHRLSTISGADRIFVLNDGALVQSGSPRSVLGRPRLADGTPWSSATELLLWRDDADVELTPEPGDRESNMPASHTLHLSPKPWRDKHDCCK